MVSNLELENGENMKFLKKSDEFIAIALLAGLTVFAFVQVLFRFVFNLPLDWSEELIRYILIVLIYLSAAITVREDKMIKVELIDFIIKGKKRKVLELVINVFSMAFMIFLSYQTTFLVRNAISVNQTSPSLQIPLSIMYGIEGVMFVLMALMFVKQIVVKFMELTGSAE